MVEKVQKERLARVAEARGRLAATGDYWEYNVPQQLSNRGPPRSHKHHNGVVDLLHWDSPASERNSLALRPCGVLTF